MKDSLFSYQPPFNLLAFVVLWPLSFVLSIPIWYIGSYCKIVDPAAAAAAGETQQTGWGYLAMVCVSS